MKVKDMVVEGFILACWVVAIVYFMRAWFPMDDVELYEVKEKTVCYKVKDRIECFKRYKGATEEKINDIHKEVMNIERQESLDEIEKERLKEIEENEK